MVMSHIREQSGRYSKAWITTDKLESSPFSYLITDCPPVRFSFSSQHTYQYNTYNNLALQGDGEWSLNDQ